MVLNKHRQKELKEDWKTLSYKNIIAKYDLTSQELFYYKKKLKLPSKHTTLMIADVFKILYGNLSYDTLKNETGLSEVTLRKMKDHPDLTLHKYAFGHILDLVFIGKYAALRTGISVKVLRGKYRRDYGEYEIDWSITSKTVTVEIRET